METKHETLSLTVTPTEAGQRFDKYLGTHAQIGSRSRAAALIDDGRAKINGKTVKASAIVAVGDTVTFEIPSAPTDVGLVPLDLKLEILFEDKDVIVINKPAGLVVHPAAGHLQDTLVNALVHHTDELAMGFSEKRPGIVHRLDRDTSGVIVVAKNDAAHTHLSAQFKAKTTHRVYWAIIYGVLKKDSGTFESFLARHPVQRKKFGSNSKTGKRAVTHYRTLAKHPSKQVSLVELQLETGRTHQIRVHLSEAGHPIIGDLLYGSPSRVKTLKSVELRKLVLGLNRFALHAAELGFKHPTTDKDMKFSVGWPDDLARLVQYLGFDHEK